MLSLKPCSEKLLKRKKKKVFRGKIVEVEAYNGDSDEAAHSFNGITPRNKAMFELGGHLYVYFIYGTHFCANIVVGAKGKGNAILLRGIEPLEGIPEMGIRRFGREVFSEKEIINISNGPGKICRAFGIDKTDDGSDLTGNNIYILHQPELSDCEITTTTRVGLTKGKEFPWRFYITDNPFVSRK